MSLPLSLVFLAAGALPPAAEKTDRVVLSNGDVVTCEIKNLDRGVLTVKTDPMSTIEIKWVYVAGLHSAKRFSVELDDGTRLFGVLLEGTAPGKLRVFASLPLGVREVDLERVVFLDELEPTFRDRIKGNLSLGFTFTKASEVAQLSLGFGLKATTEKHEWSVNGSTINTSQADRPNTNRSDLSLGYRRFLGQRWFALAGTSLQRNDELGLDLRTKLDLGGGRYLVQSKSMLLSAVLGASVNHEIYSEGSDTNNLEGILSLEYAWFLLETPKLDLEADVTVYPSVTSPGRTRLESEFRVRKEFVKDLFLSLKLYGDYDSEPSEGASSSGDYGVVASIDYSW